MFSTPFPRFDNDDGQLTSSNETHVITMHAYYFFTTTSNPPNNLSTSWVLAGVYIKFHEKLDLFLCTQLLVVTHISCRNIQAFKGGKKGYIFMSRHVEVTLRLGTHGLSIKKDIWQYFWREWCLSL